MQLVVLIRGEIVRYDYTVLGLILLTEVIKTLFNPAIVPRCVCVELNGLSQECLSI
jgi:hypothetical protein